MGDLIDRGCDIVFIEFAVNDNDADRPADADAGRAHPQAAGRRRPGSVFVYTFCHDMYEAMMDGRMPASIAEFEELRITTAPDRSGSGCTRFVRCAAA